MRLKKRAFIGEKKVAAALALVNWVYDEGLTQFYHRVLPSRDFLGATVKNAPPSFKLFMDPESTRIFGLGPADASYAVVYGSIADVVVSIGEFFKTMGKTQTTKWTLPSRGGNIRPDKPAPVSRWVRTHSPGTNQPTAPSQTLNIRRSQ